MEKPTEYFIENKIARIRELQVLPKNKETILSWNQENSMNGIRPHTRLGYLSFFEYLLKYMGDKPLKQATKGDIIG